MPRFHGQRESSNLGRTPPQTRTLWVDNQTVLRLFLYNGRDKVHRREWSTPVKTRITRHQAPKKGASRVDKTGAFCVKCLPVIVFVKYLVCFHHLGACSTTAHLSARSELPESRPRGKSRNEEEDVGITLTTR